MMHIEHLSFSSINQYIECGLQYRFRKIDNLEPEFISEALIFGSCIHKALADYNAQRQRSIDINIDEVTSMFETYWIGSLIGKNVKFSNGNDAMSCLHYGKKLLQTFHEHTKNSHDCIVLDIEKSFKLEIEDFPCPIIGYIDLIEVDEEENVLITEYKTSSKSYSSGQIDKHDQVTLYHMAIQNMYPDKHVLSKIDCLIKTKTPKFEQYYTHRDFDDHQRFIKVAREVARSIQAEIFIPNRNSWKCTNCEYKTACDHWLKS